MLVRYVCVCVGRICSCASFGCTDVWHLSSSAVQIDTLQRPLGQFMNRVSSLCVCVHVIGVVLLVLAITCTVSLHAYMHHLLILNYTIRKTLIDDLNDFHLKHLYNCCEWTTSRLIIDKGDNVDPGWDKRRDKCQHPKYIIEHMPLCSSDFLSLYCAIIRAVRFSGRVVDSRSRVRLALVSHWSTHFLFLGHGRAVFLFHDSSFRADVLLCVFVLSWFSVFHELTDICETPRLSTFHPFPSNRVSFIDTR
ncbi:hypothetical protein T4D_7716 [Trichinella pseudospiralis]|uniref:Uncharacterized protein n=1 Tax=Trichinella pseudospiralis TaxID=6337 RepID=A0A0V1FGV1_TRIPS|nr:hypothetical protein T4D_7716 [Trichinella pseudospiralis]